MTKLKQKSFVAGGILALAVMLLASTANATQEFTIKIKNHKFDPAELTVPANEKVKLRVINEDSTAEEFESYELDREKVISGGSSAVIFIGPLKAGEYPFFGEFNPETAQGKIFAK